MPATASLVTGVDFVSVPTRDLDAARAFYGEVLGLEAGKVWQGSRPDALGAEFETGTVTLAVIVGERLGIPFQPSTTPIALQVDDVAAARAELEARGVTFNGEIVDSGVCHMSFFTDPDGNALLIHHRYAPPGA